MAEVREWWANVYPYAPEYRRVGVEHPNKGFAEDALRCRRDCVDQEEAPAFRIHVRMKPEGAPKRYASAMERGGWETDPDTMRRVAKIVDFYSRHHPALDDGAREFPS
ncbi:hypothetical protein [Methylobacterium sp. Leaf399]|uniref:hypothetical protein n=1 Tax=Methylobacterium sp. Leaf399 TaxID=1736364 RepID=UPI000B2A7675|nr:hypothetical protein [Methylobacterium sp. Leaf399]